MRSSCARVRQVLPVVLGEVRAENLLELLPLHDAEPEVLEERVLSSSGCSMRIAIISGKPVAPPMTTMFPSRQGKISLGYVGIAWRE